MSKSFILLGIPHPGGKSGEFLIEPPDEVLDPRAPTYAWRFTYTEKDGDPSELVLLGGNNPSETLNLLMPLWFWLSGLSGNPTSEYTEGLRREVGVMVQLYHSRHIP